MQTNGKIPLSSIQTSGGPTETTRPSGLWAEIVDHFAHKVALAVKETATLEIGETQQQQALELATLREQTEQIHCLLIDHSRKLDELVRDIIERNVTDHLFKEFARLATALRQTAAQPEELVPGQLNDIADGIDLFLNESELRLLHPTCGEALNPREHQPILIVATAQAGMDGTISQTLVPGLARKHRVVQLARVSVFKFSVNNKNNGV